jgi:RNA polymerase sigma factor (sigma-70 family)
VLGSSLELGPDAELLDRYVRQRDQEAFADLVARHGPMVMNVCRRVLIDHHAAEEAWQGTFLVLARRAASVRPAEALPAWLHGVARRVALKARSTASRRALCSSERLTADPPDPRADPLAEVSVRELLTAIDEEVGRLPEFYRLPVLQCCFEGQTQEEAARQLGWSPGSLQGRLERGRKRLHDRLTRRGLTLTAALAAIEASRAAAGPVSAALASPVIAAAALVSAGKPLAPGIVPKSVVALAEGVLHAMFMMRIKTVMAALLLAAALITGGGLLLSLQSVAARQDDDSLIGSTRTRAARDDTPKTRVIWTEKHAFEPQSGRADQIFCAAFSPDGKLIFCGMSSNGKLLDATTGEEKAVIAFNHPMQCAFSPDGTMLATGHLDALMLWETKSGKLLATLDDKTMNMSKVIFTRDGKHLLSAETNKVRLWDVASKKEVRSFTTGDPGTRVVYGAAFSPDEKLLATAEGPAKKVIIWEVASAKEIRTIASFTNMATAVAYSPAGQSLACSDGAGVVKLFDPKTGKLLGNLKAPIGAGSSLAFSPDGKTLASVGVESPKGDPKVRLWHVAPRKQMVTLTNHTRNLWTVAFSRDGKRMVTAGDDAVRVWEAETRPAK